VAPSTPLSSAALGVHLVKHFLASSRDLGRRLAVDHYSQGPILVLLVVSCLLAQSFTPIVLSLPSLLLQISYGGKGTFQFPPRHSGTEPTIADPIIVAGGIVSALAFLTYLLWRLVRFALTTVSGLL
jgi:hypothetical protein